MLKKAIIGKADVAYWAEIANMAGPEELLDEAAIIRENWCPVMGCYVLPGEQDRRQEWPDAAETERHQTLQALLREIHGEDTEMLVISWDHVWGGDRVHVSRDRTFAKMRLPQFVKNRMPEDVGEVRLREGEAAQSLDQVMWSICHHFADPYEAIMHHQQYGIFLRAGAANKKEEAERKVRLETEVKRVVVAPADVQAIMRIISARNSLELGRTLQEAIVRGDISTTAKKSRCPRDLFFRLCKLAGIDGHDIIYRDLARQRYEKTLDEIDRLGRKQDRVARKLALKESHIELTECRLENVRTTGVSPKEISRRLAKVRELERQRDVLQAELRKITREINQKCREAQEYEEFRAVNGELR